LFTLKAIAEAIAPGLRVQPATQTWSYEHPARTADLVLGDQKIGRLFEAHPQMLEGRAGVLDLDLDLVFQQRKPAAQYKPIGRFPSSAFDLSIVVPARVYSSQFEDAMRQFAGPLMEQVEYVREFQEPDGRKSVTFRVTVGAPDRTLPSAEINAVRAEIIDKLRSLGYELKV
jgi:phenylalanyl-tRNA synthetase beta chain